MENIIQESYQEILQFIKENKDNGYNVYSNIDDINELIDIIVKWYEFKYSKGSLEVVYSNYVTKKYNQSGNIVSCDIDELYTNMGYYELMYRIPIELHSIIECHYKGEKCVEDIKLPINNNSTSIKSSISVNFNKHDGNLTVISLVILERYFKIKAKCIEDLLNKEKFSKKIDYSKLDFSEIENAVVTHNLDLELRDKIFDLIVLKLFFSDENNYFGYIRAKKFIDEFNCNIKGVNLSIEKLNNMIEKRYIGFDKEYFENIFNEIFNKEKNDSFEASGLTFETIKNLKKHGICKLFDVSMKNKEMAIIFNSIYEISCNREKQILRQKSFINDEVLSCNPFIDETNNKLDENKKIKSLRKYFFKNKR